MQPPADPILRAAVRWLENLLTSPVDRTSALFRSHSSFTDITPTQYAAALSWLQDVGLVDEWGQVTSVENQRLAVFRAAISEALWFPDADVLVSRHEDIPEDAVRAANALGLHSEDAFAAIHHEWGKVDTAIRAHVGARGETALVELLATIGGARVVHVAANSDGYGYDVAVELRGMKAHLEVKTTTRRGRLTIYLSRNEYQVMMRDPFWSLVAVRLDQHYGLAAVAIVDREWIAAVAPTDQAANARWESMRVDVPPEHLISGLGRVAEALQDRCPAILNGHPSWPG